MKIIIWNCNMAFRKKVNFILEHYPDILVVPECEHPKKLMFSADLPQPTDMLWFGKNKNKGIGIFSFNNFSLKLIETHNPNLEYIIPISVSGGQYTFTLYAVWANNTTDPEGRYIEQVWKAINYHANELNNNPSILIGDFNSNTIWDKKHGAKNHSNVVKALEEIGISSAYHLFFKQMQGKEEHPTLYMYRHENKPYHIDYCFMSKELSSRIQSVEVGDFKIWSQYSDHVPVIVTIK